MTIFLKKLIYLIFLERTQMYSQIKVFPWLKYKFEIFFMPYFRGFENILSLYIK